MSVAFELDYEVFRPRLNLLPDHPVRAARTVQIRQRRLRAGRRCRGGRPARPAHAPHPRPRRQHRGRCRPGGGPDVHRQGRRHPGLHRPAHGRRQRGRPGSQAGRREPAPPWSCRGSTSAFRNSLAIVGCVRCPWCAVDDDRVVDSAWPRTAGPSGAAASASAAAAGSPPSSGSKRSRCGWSSAPGSGSPSIGPRSSPGCVSACKNRPVTDAQMEELAQTGRGRAAAESPEPTSQQVGVAVLERLQALDDVAYLRFASVYKGFEDAGDFQREVGLLTKTTEPKRGVSGRVDETVPDGGAGRLRPSRRRRRGLRGTLARWAKAGQRVHLVICTDGGKGPPIPAAKSGSWPPAGRRARGVVGRDRGGGVTNLGLPRWRTG